jgi:hypothetical protein
MDFRFVPPDLRRLDDLSAEVLACAIWEDEWPMLGLAGLIDWRLAGKLSGLAKQGFLTGRADEAVMMPARPRLTFEKLLVLGLGKRETFDDDAVLRAVKRLLGTLEGLQIKRAVVELPGRADGCVPPERAAQIVRTCAGESEAHDAWWLVEDADAEKAITQKTERDARRARRA